MSRDTFDEERVYVCMFVCVCVCVCMCVFLWRSCSDRRWLFTTESQVQSKLTPVRCICGWNDTREYFPFTNTTLWPPLWSSGYSSSLQIQRSGFDSRHYQKKVVGLERGSLSLVSTIEEILDRKVAAPV
jgi:hypothetical protein